MQEMRMLRLIRWKAELDRRGFASHSSELAKGSFGFFHNIVKTESVSHSVMSDSLQLYGL